MDITFFDLAILLVAAFASGFVDSIAGGGGLISMPAFILTGISPLNMLATVKVQACVGTGFSAYYFIKKGLIKLKECWYFGLFAFVFGALGAKLVSMVPSGRLEFIIPILLLSVSLYVLFSPAVSDIDKKAKLTSLGYGVIFAPLIAAYDGFFGPGSGSFYIITLISLLGMNASKASATAKILNTFSNLGSVSFFIFSGYVLWKIAFLMAILNVLGNLTGARLVFLKGSKIVKPFLLVVSLSVCIKEVWGLLK